MIAAYGTQHQSCRASASEASMSRARCELHLHSCSVKRKGSVCHWQDYTNEEHNTVISRRNEKNKGTRWPRLASAGAAVRLINSCLYSHRLHSHLISCFNRPHCSAFVTPSRGIRPSRTPTEDDCLIRREAVFSARARTNTLPVILQGLPGFPVKSIPWRAKLEVWRGCNGSQSHMQSATLVNIWAKFFFLDTVE